MSSERAMERRGGGGRVSQTGGGGENSHFVVQGPGGSGDGGGRGRGPARAGLPGGARGGRSGSETDVCVLCKQTEDKASARRHVRGRTVPRRCCSSRLRMMRLKRPGWGWRCPEHKLVRTVDPGPLQTGKHEHRRRCQAGRPSAHLCHGRQLRHRQRKHESSLKVLDHHFRLTRAPRCSQRAAVSATSCSGMIPPGIRSLSVMRTMTVEENEQPEQWREAFEGVQCVPFAAQKVTEPRLLRVLVSAM